MIYKDYKYIYPPRPENTFPRDGMDKFDNDVFVAQPKFNGSCTDVYCGPDLWKTMNRHKQPLTGCKLTKNEFEVIIPKKGNNLIVGEYMNKSKKDEFGKVFNHKLMIFDVLVIDGEYLIGKTFQERLDILYEMFIFEDENDYSLKITDNIYMTKSFYKGFSELWDKLVTIDMIEGLVLKRKDAGLELGLTEKNNTRSMLKCRKSTKNYNY